MAKSKEPRTRSLLHKARRKAPSDHVQTDVKGTRSPCGTMDRQRPQPRAVAPRWRWEVETPTTSPSLPHTVWGAHGGAGAQHPAANSGARALSAGSQVWAQLSQRQPLVLSAQPATCRALPLPTRAVLPLFAAPAPWPCPVPSSRVQILLTFGHL